MKKFKVIEESRFVNKDEMGNVKGGISTTCSAKGAYSHCLLASYITCGPALSGYQDGQGGHCALDVKFEVSTCGGLGWFTTNCGIGSGRIYTT